MRLTTHFNRKRPIWKISTIRKCFASRPWNLQASRLLDKNIHLHAAVVAVMKLVGDGMFGIRLMCVFVHLVLFLQAVDIGLRRSR